MQKHKNLIESIVVFIFSALIVSLINLNSDGISYDKIWVFHMLQKIANGALIYKNINIIVGPVFYIIGGFIFKIFGTNFIVYNILGGVSFAGIATITYNIVKEINSTHSKAINIFIIIVLYYFTKIMGQANYNLTSIFFILLAMYLEIKKSKINTKNKLNIFIGISLGLAFFSKQNVGGTAILASGIITILNGIRNKNNGIIKELFEKALGCLIVAIPILIIMQLNGILFDYFNLCFGSILEFGKNNFGLINPTIYLLIMIGILGSFIFLLKNKKEDKELLIIECYALSFIFFMIPILNAYHTHVATFFIYFLVIKLLNELIEKEKMDAFKLISVVILVLFVVSLYKTGQTIVPNEDITLKKALINLIVKIIDSLPLIIFGISIIKNKYDKTAKYLIINMILLIITLIIAFCISDKVNIEGLEIYSNQPFKQEEINKIANVVEYIKNKENEGYNVYVISWDASEYMVPLNRNNGNLDLLLSGNLGYNGIEKMLNQIKTYSNALILKNKKEFWQEPKKIMEYVKSLELVDEIEDLEVYYKP